MQKPLGYKAVKPHHLVTFCSNLVGQVLVNLSLGAKSLHFLCCHCPFSPSYQVKIAGGAS